MLGLGVLVATGLVLTLLAKPWDRPSPISGQVVNLDGQPISGATVSAGDERTSTGGDGRFLLQSRQPAPWVTVSHPSYLSRTRAAGANVLVRLTPDDGETISLNFTGDVMFGRRFYDPNEDGNTADGLLRPCAGIPDHLALLDGVRPRLENADLTIINLETPLISDPYFDSTKPRPSRFHPTKEFVFASAPETAAALRDAGVDIIGLANNHLYDALEQGISTTLETLDQAGFRSRAQYFGAGNSEEEAWRLASSSVRGQRIAFLGCTSITGDEHPLTYVASGSKGGAARCEEGALRSAVSQARVGHDIVVFQIHGGYEYGRDPSDTIQRLTDVAREAGATLVVNHHPHVVGGFDWDGSSLVAWTLGNFVFDQTVSPTFESYLLTVHLRRGQVVRAYAEPLMIEGYVPKGLTGGLSDFVARGAAGRAPGPFLIEDGAMEVDLGNKAVRRELRVPLGGDIGVGTILRLDPGSWPASFAGPGTIRLGRDLLWVGGFEGENLAAQHREGARWMFDSPTKRLGAKYAYEGAYGAHIESKSNFENDNILTPSHRLLVRSGTELSVIGMARSQPGTRVNVQLSWYPDTKGSSNEQTTVPLNAQANNTWAPFRVDVTVPPGAVAVGLYLRLEPPTRGVASADFDNVRVLEWAAAGANYSSLYDHIRIKGQGEVTMVEQFLPGAEEWAVLRAPTPLPQGMTATPAVTGPASRGTPAWRPREGSDGDE